MDVADVHVDRAARLDVGDGLGEDVGALLDEQARDVAHASGREVGALGLLALADDAPDPPLADGHDELVYRGVRGQREGVDRLDLLGEGIVEALGHAHGGDEAGDVGPDVGVLQGDGDLLALDALAAGEERALARTVRLVGLDRLVASDDPDLLLDAGAGKGRVADRTAQLTDGGPCTISGCRVLELPVGDTGRSLRARAGLDQEAQADGDHGE